MRFDPQTELERQRRRLLAALDGLPEVVVSGQHWPILGPILWDLNHIGCFEDFWLCCGGSGTGLPEMFNAFVHERSVRGALDIPDLLCTLAELAAVRRHALGHLEAPVAGPLTEHGFVFHMVAQHESWHLETILASIGLAGCNRERCVGAESATVVEDVVEFPAAEGWIGTEDRSVSYDNERGRHPVRLGAYGLDRFPVTNSRFEAFIEAGGYTDRSGWSPEGWRWRTEAAIQAPHFWRTEGIERFGRVVDRVGTEPVQHVSFYEAEAFARWAGGRLPTEAEWEAAATWGGEISGGADVESAALGPASVGAHGGDGASGCRNLLGGVWEWTASGFEAYPGFRAFPYPEYSAPFFGGEYRVLRGGCWASSECVARPTLRSWDHPYRRETIFAGLRVAYDR